MKGYQLKELIRNIDDDAEVISVSDGKGLNGIAVLDEEDTVVDLYPILHSKDDQIFEQ